MQKIYNFTVLDIEKKSVSMTEYQGKVLLIVNTATDCGFTPQYEELQSLYEKYKDSGLVILDFPSNQFANQNPGTEEEIRAFCHLNYHTSFPLFAKIKVNGDGTEPLYKWLKDQKSGALGRAIRWNFTKFLINRNGYVVARYEPNVRPLSIEKEIVKLLKQ